ncbi:phage holin family protein [Aeromicrobium sp.]|uniref:phage holin family protein n=1 Tax=Aeromicrobium sp. TaxID=1871063 RepID=UPI003D6A15F7
MFKQLIFVWLAVAVAIAITAAIVPSVEIDGGVLSLLGVALVLGFVNALIGPVLRLISIPLTVVTFGLFGLVVNGALLGITAGLTDALDVGGFLAVIVAAILISVISGVLVFVGARVFSTETSE